MQLKEIYQPISRELLAVEKVLTDSLREKDPYLSRISRHVLKSPGKRLRPALALFSAKIHGRINQPTIELAAAIELIHTATLVQDDVIDRAHSRRGEKAVRKLFGNNVSVLFGDYLFSKAFGLLAEIKDLRLLSILVRTAKTMAAGEIEQLRLAGKKIARPKYLEIINQKTAGLMAAACEAGALSAGAAEARAKEMSRFGRHFGLAFQIIDDCLDERKFPWPNVKTARAEAAKYIEQAFALTSFRSFLQLGDFVLNQV